VTYFVAVSGGKAADAFASDATGTAAGQFKAIQERADKLDGK
jgi:hypothetical protein